MIGSLAKKLFGTKNDREIKRLSEAITHINALEAQYQSFSDDQLKHQTTTFKEQLAQGKPLNDILPDAFAVVREAGRRVLKMRHFDVQLIGGMVLHEGKIAEMKTGEGKTLVATLPAYLNALEGKGVHVVTVNDYLARRDAEWMGKLYGFLNMTVGTITHGLTDTDRKAAYGSDITYGTNNEFGFDYLRDNMKFSLSDYVQREFNFAIVDEVDSILIDEARTPLIISGPTEESTDKYYHVDQIIPGLKKDQDYTLDEESRTVALTEDGVATVEKRLGVDNIYDPRHMNTLHHVNQALKAHTVFKRDVDYVVKNNQVIIVDEFTGRLMPGRRFSDGLHQALEAKEKVKIERENQTLATITFQNYFRMYDKLSGMTGTAETEAEEFHKIYELDVVVVPTNKPMIRDDHADVIYKTEREKFDAVVDEIRELNQKGRPVLVGTISIEKSEHLSKLLTRHGIKHHVLNAKHHEEEAEIVSRAGQKHSVTISTNMAGRGTDIVLGEGVADIGGLHILGTERHESRRIDNQLRGRSGRQGDKGSSRFFLSLEDDLLRIFGSDRIATLMASMGMEDGTPIEHRWITKAIENAQKRVEGRNFDIRKHLLKYDDVLNQQRKIVYAKRQELLEGKTIKENTVAWIEEMIEDIVTFFVPEKSKEDPVNFKGLTESVFKQFNLTLDFEQCPDHSQAAIQDYLREQVFAHYKDKAATSGETALRHIERVLSLRNVDALWKEHLQHMEHLRESVSLRGYAQKDPLLEYQKEGFDMFTDMFFRIKEHTVEQLFKIQIRQEDEEMEIADERQKAQLRQSQEVGGGAKKSRPKTVQRTEKKVGRNDPCPCGSGKKYKKCHGT